MRNPLHKTDCDCADCWEPRPGPGETLDQAVRRELAKELTRMDEVHLGIMIEMVAAEQQRRYPLPPEEMAASANMDGVKEIVGILCDAIDARFHDATKTEVRFLDAFMALVNFDRFVLQATEKQLGLTLNQQRSFRSLFVATVSKSLMSRVAN